MAMHNLFKNLLTTGILLAMPLASSSWAKAPADSVAQTAPPALKLKIDKIVASRPFQMTYIGVPLVVGSLIVKSEDDHFRQLRNDHLPAFSRHFDNYLQYLPAAVMLGMKVGGVEGRSSWGRMITSDAFSAAIMATVVGTLKATTNVTRPDGSNNRSFPSGHTATAFMTATMLSKEYGHISPWVSVGAYSVATATGLMRMANNKHWLSDVLAGAGFGILSTELGYYLADLIFKEKGINHFAFAEDFSQPYNPSFVGLSLGLNVMPGSYQLNDGSHLEFSSGSSAGIEGAYFFSPHIGVGGHFSASSTAIVWNGSAQDESLGTLAVHAGAYFSYPIVPRLLLGSKALAGYVHSTQLTLDNSNIYGKRNVMGAETGISLTFRARTNLGIKLHADYNIMASPLESHSHAAFHCLTVGGSANITF